MAAPLLDRTVECCRGLLKRLDVIAHDLSVVVTVGGGTQMPAVADLVGLAFGRPVRRADDPDLAVLSEAFLMGQVTCGAEGSGAAPDGRRDAPAVDDPRPACCAGWCQAGAPYEEGAPLARVRLDDGTIWDLLLAGPDRWSRCWPKPVTWCPRTGGWRSPSSKTGTAR